VIAAPLAVHRSNGDRPAQAVPRPALRVVKPPSEVDLVAAEQAAAAFLVALGVDLDTESLAATPARMARAYAEMFTPRSFDLTTFGNDAAYDELIIARSIPVQSVCEHHLLPFVGVAHVGYLPGRESLACPSWLGWSSCSRDAPRCKNSSPNKLLTGSKSTLRRAVWVSSWKPNIYA
jgi:GTP cyclohydrolase I